MCMPKLPEGKSMLQAYISTDLKTRLYELVKKKYEGLHGGVSMEVEHALAHWIQQFDSSLTQEMHKINPLPAKGHIIASRIKQRLANRNFMVQCSKSVLVQAIEDERGSDPRTVQKWLKWLVRNGYYKWLNASILEIV